MTVVATLAGLAYAVVNLFGAWSVVRIRPGVAGAFLLAAALLTVAAVAAAYRAPVATVWAAAGALVASLASWWNAAVVMRRVVPRRHLLRAVAGLLLVALVYWATMA